VGRYLIATIVVLAGLILTNTARAREPGWASQVVKPASERAKLQQTPIINRPYRPLHFYGNTVRRLHYHGRVLPRPGERAMSQGR